jgi:2'-5' RNA ligase
MPDSFRTFIAIEIPRELRALVIQHIKQLRHALPNTRASWVREDNLHLTLRFLGNVPVTDIPQVSSAVERATKTISPFELTISGCGVFPPRGRPNVLWLGIEPGSAGILPAGRGHPARTSFDRAPGAQASSLQTLYPSLETELAAAGFPREPRPFHPHLTIARLRHPHDARELAERHQGLSFAPKSFSVSEVVVFRSELLKEGSKHHALSRHLIS